VSVYIHSWYGADGDDGNCHGGDGDDGNGNDIGDGDGDGDGTKSTWSRRLATSTSMYMHQQT
jgi:hypothetical protein